VGSFVVAALAGVGNQLVTMPASVVATRMQVGGQADVASAAAAQSMLPLEGCGLRMKKGFVMFPVFTNQLLAGREEASCGCPVSQQKDTRGGGPCISNCQKCGCRCVLLAGGGLAMHRLPPAPACMAIYRRVTAR
jgi:hypothetical protein